MAILKTLLKLIDKLCVDEKTAGGGTRRNFFRNKYETLFFIFMLGVIYLCRNNPYLVIPQLLYVILALLLSNFVINFIFSRCNVAFWVIDLAILWNGLLTTGILYYSGGPYSYLWVLYLVPIFTAAMMRERKEVAGIAFLSVIACVTFYGNPFTAWNMLVLFEIAVKAAFLALSATLITYIVSEKQKVEVEIEIERDKLDQLTDEIAQKRLQVVESEKMVEMGKFSSGIIHDLGTPLTVIIGSARLLEEEEDTKTRADIQRIINSALLCKNIVANALDLARGQEYSLEPLDLRDPLESALAICTTVFAAQKITVEKNIKPHLPRINGSFIHLERVFLNLIFNARGALKSGGEIKVIIRPDPPGWLEVIVQDSGPGFPQWLVEKGPEVFKTTKKPGEGTGLGLYVVSKIVEKHGGEIKFNNSPEGGAVIKMRFPELPSQPA